MPGKSKRLRNVVLIAIAIACLAYAGYSIRKATRVPPASNRDEVWIVCTDCWEETALSTGDYNALPLDEETGALQCPKCGKFAASLVALRCPHCARAIPRSMVVFGTEYVCPFCQAALGSGRRQPD